LQYSGGGPVLDWAAACKKPPWTLTPYEREVAAIAARAAMGREGATIEAVELALDLQKIEAGGLRDLYRYHVYEAVAARARAHGLYLDATRYDQSRRDPHPRKLRPYVPDPDRPPIGGSGPGLGGEWV
jgi:hypothetical protein